MLYFESLHWSFKFDVIFTVNVKPKFRLEKEKGYSSSNSILEKNIICFFCPLGMLCDTRDSSTSVRQKTWSRCSSDFIGNAAFPFSLGRNFTGSMLAGVSRINLVGGGRCEKDAGSVFVAQQEFLCDARASGGRESGMYRGVAVETSEAP